MRVWDLSPGYLNRQSLLGEHRELHGLHSILVNAKTGYSRHPETRRWVGAVDALICRHQQLAAEMRVRGYTDRTPIAGGRGPVRWPKTFVTNPAGQVALLREKYAGRGQGRIPLPRTAQEAWAHHKYSVMARSPEESRRFGRLVARKRREPLGDLLGELIAILRERPSRARTINALEHMWGHVRRHATPEEMAAARRSPLETLAATQAIALRAREPYLLASTALSDLAVFLESA